MEIIKERWWAPIDAPTEYTAGPHQTGISQLGFTPDRRWGRA